MELKKLFLTVIIYPQANFIHFENEIHLNNKSGKKLRKKMPWYKKLNVIFPIF